MSIIDKLLAQWAPGASRAAARKFVDKVTAIKTPLDAWRAVPEQKRIGLIAWLIDDALEFEDFGEADMCAAALLLSLESGATTTSAESHGTGPSPDEPRLLRREELPPWCKPLHVAKSNTEIFFSVDRAVGQVVFDIDDLGASFLDFYQHTPNGRRRRIDVGDIVPLPGCVLVAVGVEQIRRARETHGRAVAGFEGKWPVLQRG